MRKPKDDLKYLEEVLQEYRAVAIDTIQGSDSLMVSSIIHKRGVDKPVTELDHEAYTIRKSGHLRSASFEDGQDKLTTEWIWLHR